MDDCAQVDASGDILAIGEMMSPLTSISKLANRRSMHLERKFDQRFGVDTRVEDGFADADDGTTAFGSDALEYYPTPIANFRRIVRRSGIDPAEFGFVDLGAGKGRTLLLAADLGFHPVSGVEIDPSLCRIARENIQRWRGRGGAGVEPVIVQGDARAAPLPSGNLFVYLFNPFTGPMFESVAARLGETAREDGRAILVAYNNDPCSNLLERTGAFRRVRIRRIRFWRPPTMSLFYNDEAWAMRRRR